MLNRVGGPHSTPILARLSAPGVAIRVSVARLGYSSTFRRNCALAAIILGLLLLAMMLLGVPTAALPNLAHAGGARIDVCGDANSDGLVSATDANIALRTAVGSADCEACACDVNFSGNTNATDGLLILQAGVGQDVSLSCASCAPPTTTTLPCVAKSLSGDWLFSLTPTQENCGHGLDNPINAIVTLEQTIDDEIIIVRPSLPVMNERFRRLDACTAKVSYEISEDGGLTFNAGIITIGTDGDSFGGDVSWEFCDAAGCSCDGTDIWSGVRQ